MRRTEEAHDVGVLQRGQRVSLAQEGGRLVVALCAHALDGDLPPLPAGQERLPKGALPQHPAQLHLHRRAKHILSGCLVLSLAAPTCAARNLRQAVTD